MGKITQIKTKDKLDECLLVIAENEGIFYIHTSKEYYDDKRNSVSMTVSKQQMKKLCVDTQKYIGMKDKIEDFTPTEQQIVDAFHSCYTGSGKLRCIQNILDDDPMVKDWIKKWLNGESLL
jgi:hypothetical protein